MTGKATLKTTAVLFSALIVGACAATSSVLLESPGSIQDTNAGLGPSREFAHFASGRDLYTEIHGNPFAMSDEEFGSQVTAILNARNSSSPTNFTMRPGPSADPAFRTIVVFNGTENYNGWTLCAGPHAVHTEPPKGDRMRIDMAFCYGTDHLHSVSGTLPRTASPDDPRFQNGLALTLALAQPEDETN